MRRGRTLVLVVLVILLLLVVGGGGLFFVLFMMPGGNIPGLSGDATPVPTTVVEVTATPQNLVAVVRAEQNIERGAFIPPSAVKVIDWPADAKPQTVVTDMAQVVGKRARITIAQGELILDTMIVQSLAELSPYGSDAAAQIPLDPPGRVAISIPYDPKSGVAYGVKDGDHVTVIVSMFVVDLDEQFQSALPNVQGSVSAADPAGAPVAIGGGSGPLGRITAVPGTDDKWLTYIIPSEPQRGRLVTQQIVKDALVLHMGEFGPNKPFIIEPTPTPDPTQPPPPPPTAVPPPTIITLVVPPQEALALNYIQRLMEKYPQSVQITLALRSASDITLADTQSVTQQFIFDMYSIQVPTPLKYGMAGGIIAPAAPATP